MKRITICIILSILTSGLKAQINSQLLYNTWVKVKVTYNDDKPLVYSNIFKYSYAKYIFKSDGKAGINTGYLSNAANNTFLINDSAIVISSPGGFEMNRLKILKLTTDELVLEQRGKAGFDQPDALKIYLVSQGAFQRSHKFQSWEFSTIANGDTVYNESPVVYAEFTAANNFQDYVRSQIQASINQEQGHFMATFIVNKTGKIDSLKIVNGISADHDKLFLKIFAKNQAFWKPALLGGKPVNVKVTVKIDHWGSDMVIPSMRFTEEANSALEAGKFDIALHYYEQSLSYVPTDVTNSYKSALCKLALGRTDGVCEALVQINQSGVMIVDELIGLVCKVNKN